MKSELCLLFTTSHINIISGSHVDLLSSQFLSRTTESFTTSFSAEKLQLSVSHYELAA